MNAVRVGKHGYNSILTTSQSVTIVSAAQNTGGIDLKSAQLWAANDISIRLIATYPDSSSVAFFYVTALSNQPGREAMPYPMNLPAGVSLTAATGNGVGSAGVWVNYDLIT
ncbi:hypothetical protein [Azospirillum agricola]|uniref:hypothetical protein n=1 Tax=Azospirillum agricola TaxID=1720247 RepID=UPI000A0EF179|nr:hypothetical protein [Azospirillum agricola]MBP2231705.1 hypothetical protein [Azospirillum agricola]SMH30357.1 hypothetical protein SAMN02982994_0295 [Azospirillum lipoferum]